MASYRVHLKYKRWDIWYHVRANTISEVLQRVRRDQEAKLRTWVPVASIVNADDMTMQEQIDRDRDLPDALDLLDARTPEEKERDAAARVSEDIRAADRFMQMYHDETRLERATQATREAARKRMAQMQEDPGQYKRVGTLPKDLQRELGRSDQDADEEISR